MQKVVKKSAEYYLVDDIRSIDFIIFESVVFKGVAKDFVMCMWRATKDLNLRRFNPRRFSRPVQSTTLPVTRIKMRLSYNLEVVPRFELGVKVLQTSALPLGHTTIHLWCPEPDLNRHSVTTEGF